MAKPKKCNLGPGIKVEEKFECPRCSAPIHPANIHSKPLDEMATRREVRLLCDACNGAFCVECSYANYLLPLGPAEEITDPVERAGFREIVNQQRVDIRLAS